MFDLHNLITTKTIALVITIWIIAKRIYKYVIQKDK